MSLAVLAVPAVLPVLLQAARVRSMQAERRIARSFFISISPLIWVLFVRTGGYSMPVLTTLIFSGMLGFLEVEMTASAASVRRYGSIMVKYIEIATPLTCR